MKARCPKCGRYAKLIVEADTRDPFSGAVWHVVYRSIGWIYCKCKGG